MTTSSISPGIWDRNTSCAFAHRGRLAGSASRCPTGAVYLDPLGARSGRAQLQGRKLVDAPPVTNITESSTTSPPFSSASGAGDHRPYGRGTMR